MITKYEEIKPLKFRADCADLKGHSNAEVVHAAMRLYNRVVGFMNNGGIDAINRRYEKKHGNAWDDPAYDEYYGSIFNGIAWMYSYLTNARIGKHRVFLNGGADCITINLEKGEGWIKCYLK